LGLGFKIRQAHAGGAHGVGDVENRIAQVRRMQRAQQVAHWPLLVGKKQIQRVIDRLPLQRERFPLIQHAEARIHTREDGVFP